MLQVAERLPHSLLVLFRTLLECVDLGLGRLRVLLGLHRRSLRASRLELGTQSVEHFVSGPPPRLGLLQLFAREGALRIAVTDECGMRVPKTLVLG